MNIVKKLQEKPERKMFMRAVQGEDIMTSLYPGLRLQNLRDNSPKNIRDSDGNIWLRNAEKEYIKKADSSEYIRNV
jgi:hypothetical protein